MQHTLDSLAEYRSWTFYVLILSGSFLFSLALKMVYNICSNKKINFDKWGNVDVVNGITNILSFIIISRSSAETFLDPTWKNNYDYIMIIVITISWLRFFMFFLLIREISQLILILIEMLADTMAFMFILIVYFLIVGSVFTTMY